MTNETEIRDTRRQSLAHHSLEPWVPDEDGNKIISQPGTPESLALAHCNWYWEDGTSSIPLEVSRANAQRIVAAVNACQGISTEALESGAIAELVALLNEAVNDMEHTSLRGMMSSQVKRFRESLDKLQRLQARLQS